MKFPAASSALMGLLWSASVRAAPNKKNELTGTIRGTKDDLHNDDIAKQMNRKLEDTLLTIDHTITYDGKVATSAPFEVFEFDPFDPDGTVQLLSFVGTGFASTSNTDCELLCNVPSESTIRIERRFSQPSSFDGDINSPALDLVCGNTFPGLAPTMFMAIAVPVALTMESRNNTGADDGPNMRSVPDVRVQCKVDHLLFDQTMRFEGSNTATSAPFEIIPFVPEDEDGSVHVIELSGPEFDIDDTADCQIFCSNQGQTQIAISTSRNAPKTFFTADAEGDIFNINCGEFFQAVLPRSFMAFTDVGVSKRAGEAKATDATMSLLSDVTVTCVVPPLLVDEKIEFNDDGFATSVSFDVQYFDQNNENGTVHLIELSPGPFPIRSSVDCRVPGCDEGFFEVFVAVSPIPPTTLFDTTFIAQGSCGDDVVEINGEPIRSFFAFTVYYTVGEGRSASALTFECEVQPLMIDDSINADDDLVAFILTRYDPMFADDTIQVIELFIGGPGKEITCSIECTCNIGCSEPTIEVEWGFSSSRPRRFESDASGACSEISDFTFVSQDGLHYVSIITNNAFSVSAEVGCMETPSLDVDETLEVNSPTPAPVPTVATYGPDNEDDTVVVFQLYLSTATRGGVPATRVSAGDVVTCVLDCTDADQSDGAEEILALNQNKLPTSLFASDVVEQSHCAVTASLTLTEDDPLLFAAVATREASLPLDATIQCTAMTPLTPAPAPAPTSPPDDGGHTCYPAVWIRKGITALLSYFDSP